MWFIPYKSQIFDFETQKTIFDQDAESNPESISNNRDTMLAKDLISINFIEMYFRIDINYVC